MNEFRSLNDQFFIIKMFSLFLIAFIIHFTI